MIQKSDGECSIKLLIILRREGGVSCVCVREREREKERDKIRNFGIFVFCTLSILYTFRGINSFSSFLPPILGVNSQRKEFASPEANSFL